MIRIINSSFKSFRQTPKAISKYRQPPHIAVLSSQSFTYSTNTTKEEFQNKQTIKDEKPPIIDDTKVEWKKLLPISVSSLLLGLSGSTILPMMPIIFKDLAVSSTGIGLTVGAAGLIRLLSNLPMGWAAEKYGRRPLLIIGPAFSAAGVALTSIASNGSHLVACRSLTGIGSCAEITASQLYLADISNAKNRARTMSIPVVATSIGNVVGPALGSILIHKFGTFSPFFMVGGLISSVIICNYFFIPETKLFRNNLTIIENNNLAGSPPPQSSNPQVSLFKELSNAFRQWKPLLKLSDIRAILYLHSTYWISAGTGIYSLLPLFCSEHFDFTPTGISGIYISIAIISILGTKYAASISDRFGRKRTLVPGSLLIGFSTILFPFSPEFYSLCSLVGIWGLGSALYGANSTAYMSDVTTEKTKSQAFVMLRSSADLGMMLGGVSAGLLSNVFGIYVPFIASGSLAVLAALNMAYRGNESNPPRAKQQSNLTVNNDKIKE